MKVKKLDNTDGVLYIQYDVEWKAKKIILPTHTDFKAGDDAFYVHILINDDTFSYILLRAY